MTTQIQHKIELGAEIRTILRSKVRTLRKTGKTPAVLYGKGQEPLSLQVNTKELISTYKEAGESTLVYVNVADKSYPTVIKDIALDPASDEIIHADFYKVNLSEKITANVPVVFIGESPAVKELKGIFVRNINELEVEALPQNLPHELVIDISVLKNFDDKVTIGDLKKGLGNIAEITVEDNDAIICATQEPKSEEELQAELEGPATDVDAVEVIEKKKDDEAVTEAEEEKSEDTKTE